MKRLVLDNLTCEIIKYLKEEGVSYPALIQKHLNSKGIQVSLLSIIRRLKNLEEFGVVEIKENEDGNVNIVVLKKEALEKSVMDLLSKFKDIPKGKGEHEDGNDI